EAEEELEGAVGSSEPDINARLSIALKTTDDEEDEPPELKNQDNLPPTPYEECLDLKIFETLAQQESQAEFQHAEGKNNDTTSLRYIDGDGTSPYRSTESSVKPSPVCCAAATPTSNSGHHGDSCGSSSSSAPCSGVRRKAKVASTSLEEPVANGTKKKVRPNGSLKSSPSQEYLQIWTTASGDVQAVEGIPVQKQSLSPCARSPPSGSSTRSGSPLEHSPDRSSPVIMHPKPIRPQPRPLTRVGCSRNDLICPPTPTHHARRLRVLSDNFGPPDLRPRNVFSPETVMSPEMRYNELVAVTGNRVDQLRVGEGREDEIETDSPVRHLTSTRLPSIPERARGALAEPEEPLPPAWEARMDSHGRIFYIDHATRTTSWQRPGAHAINGPEQHRQQLDRRYQSIRRTIYDRRDGGSRSPPRFGFEPINPRQGASAIAVAINAAQIEYLQFDRAAHPALLMICRPDFYSMLHTNTDAIQIYNRNSALKHMVSRVRRDPTCFARYQHNRDLVALVNCFAAPDKDLPTGWETKMDQSGKQFFIDHANRRTSFMDPRVPTDCPRARHRPEQLIAAAAVAPVDIAPIPPPRPPALPRLSIGSPEIPVAYNDKVVAYILEILRERHGAAACSRNLRDKINSIRVEGTAALDRLSHDLQLTILLR
ncbi:hypothetical protein RP20_CCG004597, partial [Aedes albopictus]